MITPDGIEGHHFLTLRDQEKTVNTFSDVGRDEIMEEKPYPDMTDRDVLERLLPIAQDLIETDRAKGDTPYEIFKYLETRLERIQETVKGIRAWPGGTISIISNCQNVVIRGE